MKVSILVAVACTALQYQTAQGAEIENGPVHLRATMGVENIAPVIVQDDRDLVSIRDDERDLRRGKGKGKGKGNRPTAPTPAPAPTTAAEKFGNHDDACSSLNRRTCRRYEEDGDRICKWAGRRRCIPKMKAPKTPAPVPAPTVPTPAPAPTTIVEKYETHSDTCSAFQKKPCKKYEEDGDRLCRWAGRRGCLPRMRAPKTPAPTMGPEDYQALNEMCMNTSSRRKCRRSRLCKFKKGQGCVSKYEREQEDEDDDDQGEDSDSDSSGSDSDDQGEDSDDQGEDDDDQGGDDDDQGGDDDDQGGDEDDQGGDEDDQGGDEDDQGGDEDDQGGDEDDQGGDEDDQGGDEDDQGGDEDDQGGDEDSRGKYQYSNSNVITSNEDDQGGDEDDQGGDEDEQR
eukprot:CAMPEP_0203745984 /NCGR_PEP_ID=MMETSP0098-20131031/1551_1 /ASSEMBLY_ACC=CAM_ASM_000208 /TAXON_ID=96639 /ORGANISM=" , Strain NY0313808BC1" /LENGTH=396 /DNA_ID=CAMNT_0050633929 /DNA_START=568 /DNA_END=1756 /DNA_ORIENTATION=-